MRSPAVPLLWEIWRRGRGSVGAIAVASGLSWVIDFAERGGPPGPIPSLHNEVLGLLSFLVVFAMFSYLEPTERGMGRFPRRLFTLPVSTLHLVAVPVVSGILGIELLYLLWIGRLSGPNPAHPVFVAVLLGAFMMFYQSVLWTLERLGPLRLVVLGGMAVAFFGVGILPSMGEGGEPAWRTAPVVGSVTAGLALLQFLLVWRYVGRIRSGGESDGSRLGLVIGKLTDAIPRRRRGAFRSAEAACFWFEWRCSGTGFPALVAGALVLLLAPASLLTGDDPASTVRIVVAALALPVVVAIPAGLAFSKPMFWSEEMPLLPFVAVRPLADAELITIKLKVAAVATVIAWLAVLGFLSLWLGLRADQPGVQRFIAQWRAIDAQWWLGIAGLVVAGAMFVSWRFLVAGLWAGMSGSRALFKGSLAPIGIVIVGSAIVDIGELPGWIGHDLRRLAPFLWTGVAAVAAKLWLAALGFRRTSPRWAWRYVAVWLAGVACLVGLGAVVTTGAARDLPDGDVQRVRAALILFAVLAMPMARVAWAPWFVGRNRHRR